VRVLVTGAGGYVGSAVVTALTAAGHEPVAMTHHDAHRLPSGVETRAADLRDPATLGPAVRGVDAVCHLAGLTRARESWQRPLDYFAVNVGGTVELLRAMEAADVAVMVFASTGAIYGTPEQQPMREELPDAAPHPYASSKVAAEAVLGWEARRRDLSVAALRLFNAAGRSDPDLTRLVPRVLAAAAGESGPLGINGDGSVVRDYLHVDDAAEAFVAALNHQPPAGEVRRYNIGSGTGASISDVLAAAERVFGRPVPVVHNPPAAEPPTLVCDPSRAAAELDWTPRRSDLDTILRDAWAARVSI
jgi:nucleoside-diphosphate-sugar epimerase